MARSPKKVTPKASGEARPQRAHKFSSSYNEHKLSLHAFANPIAEAPAATTKKEAKKKPAGKKAKQTKANYAILIKRALKDVPDPGWSVAKLLSFLEDNYGKDSRRHLLLALKKGESAGVFIRTRGSYRLSRSKKNRAHKKKPATKSASTKARAKKGAVKKTTPTKKKATSTKKKAATTKKTATKEKAPKKSPAVKKSRAKTAAAASSEGASEGASAPAQNVIGPAHDPNAQPHEAAGVWQYYDGTWHGYPEDSNRTMEGAYQNYLTTKVDGHQVKSGKFTYEVTFKDFTQRNTQTNTMRRLQRL